MLFIQTITTIFFPQPCFFLSERKKTLEITSVSCEFWRRSQEYIAPASVDRFDPPGDRSDMVPCPRPGWGELLPAAPFTEVAWGAKGRAFSAAAPESLPALVRDEGALSLSLLPADGAWKLLTRQAVPVVP